MQFDFQLAPGASQTIDVKGRFFKYKAGTGAIRVRVSGGGFVDVLPGQGIENVLFSGLTISDRSNATNIGSILAGDFDFRDDRITGSVDVIDNAKARTIANNSFSGASAMIAAAGQSAYMQLWNPTGSNKRLVVNSVTVAGDVARAISYGPQTTKLSTKDARAPLSKLFGTPVAASVAEYWYQSNAGDLLQNSFGNVRVVANKSEKIEFREPIVILPGSSLMFLGEGAGLFVASTEFFEDPM